MALYSKVEDRRYEGAGPVAQNAGHGWGSGTVMYSLLSGRVK